LWNGLANYQTLVNEALRRHVRRSNESLEKTRFGELFAKS